jgi:hypothetical protein
MNSFPFHTRCWEQPVKWLASTAISIDPTHRSAGDLTKSKGALHFCDVL